MTQQRLDDSIFGVDESPVGGPRAPQEPRRWLQSLLALVVSLSVLGGGAYFGYQLIRPVIGNFTETNDYTGPGTGTVEVVVESGDTGSAIATKLMDAGVIKTTKAFIDASRDEPTLSTAVQPGTYTLKKEMAAADVLAHLADPANRTVPRVTIPEGLWASEVFERLSKATKVPIKDYVAAAKKPSALGVPESADGRLEGYLFPSTYEFDSKATAVQQLTAMVDLARSELKKAGASSANEHRVLTIASLIEAEVNGEADRPKVARVILNRIANEGAPNYGLLQFDSTVSYGVKRKAVTTTDEERADDNPWNTYLHPGLPVGPIGNPGAASMQAAVKPDKGDWLFFVTVDPITGETKFAETLAEHEKNVLEFQKWCRANPDDCS